MDLSQVTLSNPDGPARVAIHGLEGTGKTTTACYFPKPLVVGPENGVPRDLGFSVPTIRPQSWPELFDVLNSLIADPHDYQTAVIDTIDWVEPLVHAFICNRDSGRETEMNKKGKPLISIEDYGFGKGYLVAEEEFCRLFTVLDVLQYRRRMHVVMLMHTIVRTFKNPAGPDYDRYEPKSHSRISAKVKEWAENVLFLHFRSDAGKISEDKERHKADPSRARAKGVDSGDATRLVGCQYNALYDAKNRVRLPAVMELTDPNVLVAHLLGEQLGTEVKSIAGHVDRADMTVGNDPDGARRFVSSMDSHPSAQHFRDAAPSAPAARPEPEPARSADYYEQQRAPLPPPTRAEERAAAKWGRDEQVTPRDGVPAHHESRQADEAARRDDAFAKARGAVEQRDEQRAASADPRNTESRTWTEPKQGGATSRGARSDEPHPNAPPVTRTPTKDEQRMIAAITTATTKADKLGGSAFRGRIEMLITNARANDAQLHIVVDLVDAIERGGQLGPEYRGQMLTWVDKSQGDWVRLEAIIKRINKNVSESTQQPAAQ